MRHRADWCTSRFLKLSDKNQQSDVPCPQSRSPESVYPGGKSKYLHSQQVSQVVLDLTDLENTALARDPIYKLPEHWRQDSFVVYALSSISEQKHGLLWSASRLVRASVKQIDQLRSSMYVNAI